MKKRERILLDANVVSTLAETSKTGTGFLKEQEFYRGHAENAIWHVTPEVLTELRLMRKRTGKVALYNKCIQLLDTRNTTRLSKMDLPHIENREDVKNALDGHDKTQSDRRDRRNVCRAIYEKLIFLCHDNRLYQRVKKLAGLAIVSLHGQAKKGRKNVRRGRGGNRLN